MPNEMLESRFVPLGSLILIRRDAPKTHIGSLKLPDRSISRSQFGTVIAAGPGQMIDGMMRPVGPEEGDYVFFDEIANRFAHYDMEKKTVTLLSDDFADYALVPELAVMGVLKSNEEKS